MDQRSLDTAAKSGNIDLLYELIHEDPYVLDKIDHVPFVDTPLHVAAIAGKTEFAMEILNLKPSFARKLNADGLTPLHLAVDDHHYGFVLEVVKFDPCLVRLKGRQGMTPLLQAVSENKIDLVSEFFLVCPESIVDANVNGENALHIAVKKEDQREGLIVLSVLMGWILRLCQKDAELIETRFINRRDKDGNTALHLAAYENNRQAVRWMLESSKVNVNIENKENLTVLDIAVLQRHGDIKRMVKKHDGKRSVSLVKIKKTSDVLSSPLTWSETRRTALTRSYSWISEERRNALLVVATLIVTATYQSILQPPGGVNDGDGGTSGAKAGSVVIGEASFIMFWLCNSMGFLVATGMTLILLSLGQESTFRYYPLFFPLWFAYGFGGGVIAPTSRACLIGFVGSVVVLIFWSWVVSFWEWVQSKQAKARGPKSGLVWEGFTSLDQARGIAPKGFLIRGLFS